MTEDQKKMRRRITFALIGLPFIIAFFVVGGVFFGFYLSDVLVTSNRVIFPLIFATIGLVFSIVVSYFIAKKVSYT